MNPDDPIDLLERELVAAARRAAPPAPARAPGAMGRTWLRTRGSVRRGALVAAVLIPVIAVAAIALLLRSGSGPPEPSTGAADVSPQAVLAVLRRPGTAPTGEDLGVIERTARAVRNPSVTVQRRLLRRVPVRVAPAATDQLDLAVVRTDRGRPLIGLNISPSSEPSGTSVMFAYATHVDQAYATVGQLRSRGVSTWLGEGPGNTQDLAVLVPDGVARVRLAAPGHPTATVHDNVAGFRLADTSPEALSRPLAMTWSDAAGRVVRRVRGASLPSVARLRARADAALVALRAHLAVLRAPATTADRAARSVVRQVDFPGMTVITSSARVARTGPSSGPIVLALVRELAEGTAAVLVSDRHGASPVDLSQLLRAGGVSSTSGGGGTGRTTVLVPDGVREVALAAGAERRRAPVRDNVAVLPGTFPGPQTATVWYGAGGRVIRRIPAPGR
jgi:hypothetical protein